MNRSLDWIFSFSIALSIAGFNAAVAQEVDLQALAKKVDKLTELIEGQEPEDKWLGGVAPTPAQLDQMDRSAERDRGAAAAASADPLPAKLDYAELGFVSGPKRQVNSDCWAFCTISAAEGAAMKAKAMNLPSLNLSEQSVIDCSGFGSARSGGWIAFKWLKEHGTYSEASYRYQGVDQRCRNPVTSPVRAKDFGVVSPRDAQGYPTTDAIKRALVDHGPVGTYIYASRKLMGHTTGVFTQYTTRMRINHCVTIVGWDDAKSAWRVKNSWGASWGEGGLGWIRFGENSIGYGSQWVDMDVSTVDAAAVPAAADDAAKFPEFSLDQ